MVPGLSARYWAHWKRRAHSLFDREQTVVGDLVRPMIAAVHARPCRVLRLLRVHPPAQQPLDKHCDAVDIDSCAHALQRIMQKPSHADSDYGSAVRCVPRPPVATGLQAIGTYIHVERGGHAVVLVAQHPAHASVVLSRDAEAPPSAPLCWPGRAGSRAQSAKTADGVWSVCAFVRCSDRIGALTHSGESLRRFGAVRTARCASVGHRSLSRTELCRAATD